MLAASAVRLSCSLILSSPIFKVKKGFTVVLLLTFRQREISTTTAKYTSISGWVRIPLMAAMLWTYAKTSSQQMVSPLSEILGQIWRSMVCANSIWPAPRMLSLDLRLTSKSAQSRSNTSLWISYLQLRPCLYQRRHLESMSCDLCFFEDHSYYFIKKNIHDFEKNIFDFENYYHETHHSKTSSFKNKAPSEVLFFKAWYHFF